MKLSTSLACLCLLVLVAAATAAARTSTAGKPLALGQGMKVAGTDLFCGYGGLSGHVGILCARNSAAGTKKSWAFRIEEGQLVVFRFVNGKTISTKSWGEPKTQAEPSGSSGTGLTPIGTATLGSGFVASGTDLGCGVAAFAGKTGIGCAKRDAVGAADLRSYGIEMTQSLVEVLHVDAKGNVKTIWSAH